jgi:hypothetical protein
MSDAKSLEQTFARVLNGPETAFTLGAVVTLSRLDSSHQSHLGAVGQSNLLMTTANSENRLARLFDD